MKRYLSQVPTLRISSYSDKAESCTRSILTVILFIGIILCFLALLLWKYDNRSISQFTVHQPSFETFLSLNQSFQLTCEVSNNYVPFQFINASSELQALVQPGWTLNATFLNNPCFDTYATIDRYEGTGFFYLACALGYTTCADYWTTGNLVQSALLTPGVVQHLFYVNVAGAYLLYQSLAEEIMTSQLYFQRFLEQYMDGNSTQYSEFENYFMGYENSSSEFPEFVFNEYTRTTGLFQQMNNDCQNSFTVDYRKYYLQSRVTQCMYVQPQGIFDVFSFALTTTTSLVTLFIFTFKSVYIGINSKRNDFKRRKSKIQGIPIPSSPLSSPPASSSTEMNETIPVSKEK